MTKNSIYSEKGRNIQMAARPHLEKAPIIEAILDVRTIPATTYAPALLRSFHAKVKDFLPVYEEAYQFETQFQVGAKAPIAATEKKTECARLKAADGGFISLIQPTGFNLSKMQPYSNWEDLRDKAKSLWNLYRTEFAPQGVTRVALRYINKIDLAPGSKIEESFRTYPELSQSLPQALAGYRFQLALPSQDQKSMAIVNQVYDPVLGQATGVASVIFDIDTYQQGQLSPESPVIWDIFETLHTFKNDIFFESLTETVRKRYA